LSFVASASVTALRFGFTQRDVRAATYWGDTQLKICLARLVELEYVIAHRGRNGTFEYELLYHGDDDGRSRLSGLIESDALTSAGTQSGQADSWSGSGRPPVANLPR
jgi:hypothetical protein